jgi:hypothetical protein
MQARRHALVQAHVPLPSAYPTFHARYTLTSDVDAGLLVCAPTAMADTLWSTLIDPSPGTAEIGFLSQQNSSPETEAIDDFVINPLASGAFRINRVLAQVLVTDPTATIDNVTVEFYRTFPVDSDPNRTPAFTRTNGPSDDGNEFAEFSTDDGSLSFTQSLQKSGFVLSSTIEPGPANTGILETGPTTGDLLLLNMKLTSPLDLAPTDPFPGDPATHYRLELIAELSTGEFYWVQGVFPRTVPGVPPSAKTARPGSPRIRASPQTSAACPTSSTRWMAPPRRFSTRAWKSGAQPFPSRQRCCCSSRVSPSGSVHGRNDSGIV